MFDRLLGRSEPQATWRRAPVLPVTPTERDRAQLRSIISTAMDQAITRQTRAFDLADTPHFVDSWTASEASINRDLAQGLRIIRARSRNLARNNDWAKRFLIQLRNNVLGAAGVQLQMSLKKRNGKPNKALNALIEAEWSNFRKRGICEISGRHSLRDVERILLETLARDGEILVRLVRGRGPHGLQLQHLDPEVLDVDLRRDMGSRRIRMGVEIDDEGMVHAYWLRSTRAGDYDGTLGTQVGAHVRVPADEIIHLFVAEEGDQLRGYPWLTHGARRLWLVKDYEEAAAVASSNAAKRVGFFVAPSGDGPPPGFADQIVSSALEAAKTAGKVLSPDEIRAITEAAAKYSTTVAGQFDTLPQGYDFRPFESKFPTTNHGDFIKECLRGFTAGVGMSHATGGNNLEAVNYSSARVGITDEREQYKFVQGFLIEGLHEVVFSAWLVQALLRRPALAAINPARLDELVEGAVWQPRRWEGIDPLKDEQANEARLRNRLTSRRRIILARGEDPDEIEAELAKEPPMPAAPNTPQAAAPADEQEDAPPAEDDAAAADRDHTPMRLP